MKGCVFGLFLLGVCSLFGREFLQEEVDKAIGCIQHPHREWVTKRVTAEGKPVLDVAIIGGGQTGLTMAFALRRHCIYNVQVFDKSPEGASGSWINIGRMKTLRTPKTTTGPDLDIPVLTVRNWFSKKYGEDAWEKLDYIPRLAWHDYLNWFRRVLALPVEFNTLVGPLSWDTENQVYRFTVTQGSVEREVFARKVILATGLEGSGKWMVPDFVTEKLPRSRYSQAAWPIEENSVRGKEVAILGAGPNAFDLALEANRMGAASIQIFSKRERLVTLHCFKWGEFTGFMKCFTDLTDEQKYNFAARMYEMGQPPVPERVEKVFQLPNFTMSYASPWLDAYEEGGRVTIKTPKGNHRADFLILATGWHCSLKTRPELTCLVDKIAKWGDKYHPPKNRKYRKLLEFPYLGRGFQFTPKDPESDAYLSSLFNMTGGGLVSNGFCAGTGLTGMKYSIDLIMNEICRQFFTEDEAQYYTAFDRYDQEDFDATQFLVNAKGGSL